MFFKVLSGAVLAAVMTINATEARTVAQLGGPANLPPSSFQGDQFVDARGCIFLRAGFGGQVNWVPRVDRAHNPLCGFPPTFGGQAAAAVAADMAPEPAAPAPAAVVAAPMVAARNVAAPTVAAPTVAAPQIAMRAPQNGGLGWLFGTGNSNRVAVAAPQVQAPQIQAPQVQVPVAMTAPRYQTTTGLAAGQVGCWADAPRLERVVLRTGGQALVCTRGDGTLDGWRPPMFGPGAGVGAALTAMDTLQGARLAAANTTTRVASNSVPTPPKGYKLAWKDDRLNPLRGVGTASGQAQQDQIWTRDVPAVLVQDQPVAQTAGRVQTTVSTMSAPAAPVVVAKPAAQSGAAYVQVGTFGDPANAAGVKARLAALGLPVSTSKLTKGGKQLQIIFAGPFASAAQAQSALTAARGAGFGDAFLR